MIVCVRLLLKVVYLYIYMLFTYISIIFKASRANFPTLGLELVLLVVGLAALVLLLFLLADLEFRELIFHSFLSLAVQLFMPITYLSGNLLFISGFLLTRLMIFGKAHQVFFNKERKYIPNFSSYRSKILDPSTYHYP